MNDLPIWYKQILYQKDNRIIENGLTIPYLVGTYKTLGEKLENPIESLLNKIIESNFDKCAVLQKCPHINKYVIGIEDRGFCERLMKKDIQFKNSKGKSSLFITLNAEDLGNNLDNIVTKFEDSYETIIGKGQFSWNNTSKQWEKFNQPEIETIKKGK